MWATSTLPSLTRRSRSISLFLVFACEELQCLDGKSSPRLSRRWLGQKPPPSGFVQVTANRSLAERPTSCEVCQRTRRCIKRVHVATRPLSVEDRILTSATGSQRQAAQFDSLFDFRGIHTEPAPQVSSKPLKRERLVDGMSEAFLRWRQRRREDLQGHERPIALALNVEVGLERPLRRVREASFVDRALTGFGRLS